LSENRLVETFSSRNAEFEAENHLFWEKFRDKIGILSTHNLLCRKFVVSAGIGYCNFLHIFFNQRCRCLHCTERKS